MAYVSTDGLDDLFKTLDELGQVGNRISTSSLRKAMKPGLEIIKNNAPEDTSEGKDNLKIGTVKRYKNGGLQGAMGIDSTNWEQCKQLWFQHWGYNNYGGKTRAFRGRVENHVGWFDKASDNAKDTILNTLEDEVGKALDKILK